MSLQHGSTSYATQPYLHFTSMKASQDSRPSMHSLEKTHLSKNDVIRLVMDKEKPVFPVKAKFESSVRQPPPSTAIPPTALKRKREILDERGVEEEVARNVSKILSASRLVSTQPLPPPPKATFPCNLCNKLFTSTRNLQRHRLTSCMITDVPSVNPTPAPTPPPPINNNITANNVNNNNNIIKPVPMITEVIEPMITEVEIPTSGLTPPVSYQEARSPVDSLPTETGWRPPEGKSCPDCGKILCSSSNVRRHRATCKQALEKDDLDVAELTSSFEHSPTITSATEILKWNKGEQPWVTVGEHLKAQHLGQPIPAREPPHHLKEEEPLKSPSIIEDKEKSLDKSDVNGPAESPFTCSVCLKSFSCRKNVRRHMMAIHKVAPPPGAPLNSPPKPITSNGSAQQASEAEKLTGVTELVEADSTLDDDASDEVLSSTDSGLSVDADPLLAYFDWRKSGRDADNLPDSTTPQEIPHREYALLDFSVPPTTKKIRLDPARDDDRAVLVAQSMRFTVSRSAAMRASPLFATLLTNSREVELDVRPDSLQSLLLVHADASSLSASNIVCVSELAHRLKMTEVKTLCERYIADELPQHSIMRAIRLADSFKLVKVKEALFDSLSLDIYRSLGSNTDYREMRPELKAELLEKWGSFL